MFLHGDKAKELLSVNKEANVLCLEAATRSKVRRSIAVSRVHGFRHFMQQFLDRLLPNMAGLLLRGRD